MAQFVNILSKSDYNSDVLWATRFIKFTKANTRSDEKALSHAQLKKEILGSDLVKAVEELELESSNTDKAHTHVQATNILNEIGYSKSLTTIRWLALVLVKLVRKTLSGIYVNESQLMQLKASMGNTPVIFVPTHRSYGDFILMAFVCFYYEIEIPCVAAGLDFLSMWAMGEILRKTKAFFIRRTFQENKLYKMIFGSYVSSMVSKGDSPLEFFIEGTRSRTGKSLTAKYGFLSMVLKPYFDGDVPDIKLVPISITYDRFLEEWLFTRELLGTPKPKESTKGLLKAFSILKENYGNVYFNFGDPLSIHDWVSRECDSTIKRPLSPNLKQLASLIIERQTELQVIGASHLVMVALYINLVTNNTNEMPLNLVTSKFKMIVSVMHTLGVNVLLTKGNVHEEITFACSINPGLVVLKSEKVHLVQKVNVVHDVDSRGSGSKAIANTLDLSQEVNLLLYVNPVASLLFLPALVLITFVGTDSSIKNETACASTFEFLCELFEYEFPISCCNSNKKYQDCKKFLIESKCIVDCEEDVKCVCSQESEIVLLLVSVIHPYMLAYQILSQHLSQIPNAESHQALLSSCQFCLRSEYRTNGMILAAFTTKSFVASFLSSAIKLGCLVQDTKRENGQTLYSLDPERMNKVASLLGSLNNQFNKSSIMRTRL